MKRTLMITLIGTIISSFAFIVDIFASETIAIYIFISGFIIAIYGVSFFVFSRKKNDQEKNSFWHQLSTVGFLIAATSIFINLYKNDIEIVHLIFKIGAVVFLSGAMIPILLSFRGGEEDQD